MSNYDLDHNSYGMNMDMGMDMGTDISILKKQQQTLEKHFPHLLNALISTERTFVENDTRTDTQTATRTATEAEDRTGTNSHHQKHIELANVIQRNMPQTPQSITLVTQGNVSRFQRLLFVLERWNGPISVAMYIRTKEELYTWYTLVQEQANNALFQKYVSIHLFFESKESSSPQSPSSYTSSHLSSRHFYPINYLRNLALRNAVTESDYVFLNDIDLMPPANAHDTVLSTIQEQIQQQQQKQQQQKSDKTFWILPAFERFPIGEEQADVNDLSLIPHDKQSLLEALQKDLVAPFHTYGQTQHGYTNYAQWYNMTTTYTVPYGYKFEPYCIVKSKDLHDYFPLFRGFGKNKLSFFLEAYYRNYTFQVLPNHFVVHMDHTFLDHRSLQYDGNSEDVYPRFQEHLKEEYGIPTTSSSEQELMKTAYRYRDTMFNTTQFPCHYIMNRKEEFDIIPHYNEPLHPNTLVKLLPFPSTSQYEVSIVTMMHPSKSMFNRLRLMASQWTGQISVAVFIGSNDAESISRAKSKIRKFHVENANELSSSSSSKSFSSRISFHLVTSLNNRTGEDVNVFPRNLLRNVALDNAQTDYVTVLDIDLAPSLNAHEYLKKHLQSLAETDKLTPKSTSTAPYALVIPAFEKSSKNGKIDKTTLSTKPELVKVMEDKNQTAYKIFLLKSKKQAHNATNYDKWYTSNEMYDVDYEVDYEPYIVVRKDSNLPPFWEHFTGFGRNKLEWIEELYISGYKFKVAPDLFLIHKSHKKYGLRRVRPFIVDEYSWRYQNYLEATYGRRMQTVAELSRWGNSTYDRWDLFVKEEEKTEEVTWKRMHERSEQRDVEFGTCMDIIRSKQL